MLRKSEERAGGCLCVCVFVCLCVCLFVCLCVCVCAQASKHCWFRLRTSSPLGRAPRASALATAVASTDLKRLPLQLEARTAWTWLLSVESERGGLGVRLLCHTGSPKRSPPKRRFARGQPLRSATPQVVWREGRKKEREKKQKPYPQNLQEWPRP